MCVLGQRRMNTVLSKSAVVRARYLPDVNGVNRYKYFHRPVILPTNEVGVVCGESIDKKVSRGVLQQQRNHHELLPPISNATRSTSRVAAEKNNALSVTNSSGVPSKKKSNNNELSTTSIKSKRKTSKHKQPQELSVTNLNATTSSSTLPPIDTKTVKLYATKRLNSTWPNNESLPNGLANNSPKNSRSNERGQSKRTQSVSSLRSTDTAFLNGSRTRPSSSVWSSRPKPLPNKDSETQTDQSNETIAPSAPTIIKTFESKSELISISKEMHNSPKATQTNNLSVLARLSIRSVEDDLEQRSKLLEIVDEALEQTIDKNSRQRVNELIASSARKQAEVWRDAKEFVSTVLLPQSVAIANRAKTAKSPIDAMANVHFP